jgi:hypothetical protein
VKPKKQEANHHGWNGDGKDRFEHTSPAVGSEEVVLVERILMLPFAISFLLVSLDLGLVVSSLQRAEYLGNGNRALLCRSRSGVQASTIAI